MVIGVTFVRIVPGCERSVFNKLRSIPTLKELYHLFGEFDFLVVLEVENLPSLSATVDTIRAIGGVITTRTVVGAEVEGS